VAYIFFVFVARLGVGAPRPPKYPRAPHRRWMSIGVIAGIAHDAGILACIHDDRHKGAYFDRHLTTDPE
uniref:hypothetical protein n=1 Tax=Stenotrophomonas muris TaxID=2963283 RepID=UPI0039C751C8